MGWADNYIKDLQQGRIVRFRPKGNSMEGKISSGDTCTVAPVKIEDIKKWDIVLCSVSGNHYLHLVKGIMAVKDTKNNRFLIGNNRGGINGWIHGSKIYGKVIKIESVPDNS